MSSLGLSSRAIQGRFYDELSRVFDGAWYSDLFFEGFTDQQFEEYAFTSQVGNWRKHTGQHAPTRLTSKAIRIANERWENSLNIPIDDWRRDKTGQIATRVGELADSVGHFFDEIYTTMLIDGDIGTGMAGTAYDGQFFFDTDHSWGDSGTLQNNIDSSDVASLNVGSATAPTQAEASAAILDVIAYMLKYKDDKGRPSNGGMRRVKVVCPTNLWGPMHAACTASRLNAASGAVGDNSLITSGFSVTAHANPRLDADSTSVFYVFRADGRTKPFIQQEEVPVTIDDACAEGSEYASHNKELMWSAEWVGGFGYGQWQHAVRCTLS